MAEEPCFRNNNFVHQHLPFLAPLFQKPNGTNLGITGPRFFEHHAQSTLDDVGAKQVR